MDEQLNSCPECSTQVEPWETVCHKCKKALSGQVESVIVQTVAPGDELKQSFSDWLDSGELALKQKDYERASVDFQEALRRLPGISKSASSELRVRYLLAQALEKSGKYIEALNHYTYVAENASDKKRLETCQKKIEKLSQLVEDVDLPHMRDNAFRSPEQSELSFAPFYCSSCKRLLSEAEVYAFRKHISDVVRCLCSAEGAPLVKYDILHQKYKLESNRASGITNQTIEAAQKQIPGGRKRAQAIILALLLGNFGAHRFYLGENFAGACYFSMCWTLLPWLVAMFDALTYWHMSDMTFNLTYNIEKVISLLPEETIKPNHLDQFSMVAGEGPEDQVAEAPPA